MNEGPERMGHGRSRDAPAAVDVLIIVDTLSFSTAVDVAVSRGAIVYPFSYGDHKAAQAEADRVGAVLAHPRRAAGGQFSLSPVSLAGLSARAKLVLPSPNGSRLSAACNGIPALAGCLRNADAVAKAAREVAGSGIIGVVPAGERWPDGSLRPAIEDLLGAGAIIDRIALPCSPEAKVFRDAYRSAGQSLNRLIRDSLSGRELTEAGYVGDVEIALEQNVSAFAPRLIDGAYRAG
ncbi:2-phosphosulfolactate phosphatase [Microvirga terricola]|uniref:2-phosphosulfolactate phosphatase n=1 Tax=Microvirga terricola TaxID=2719797 RepID=UPI00197BEA61|nr:2-phosphosulfolactate phosphatase [Microvirga terricola]